MGLLQNQVAVVTGAGRGIGRAMALALAADGARVALASRSVEQLAAVAGEITTAGGTALCVPTDVADANAVRHMADTVEAGLGPIDLLVNNAGSFFAIGPVWEVDPARWERDLQVNLFGLFRCCRAVLPGMVVRNSGRIINVIGGGAGTSFPYGSGYGSSKAAVTRFTECVADELRLADSAVAVFSLSPGLVRTELTEFQLRSPEGRQWMSRIEQMFAEGKDVPPTRAAGLTVALATGRFDRLSGRWFGVTDDLDAIAAEQDDILRHDRKTLRFRI